MNTRVFRIDAPATRSGEFQVLSTTDGRVYFIAPTDANLLTRIRNFAKTSQPARLILDGERVIDFSPLSGAEASDYTDAFNTPAAIEEAESAHTFGRVSSSRVSV